MPLYEYKCLKCGHTFEVRHMAHKQPFKICPLEGCNGKLVRIIRHPPTIIFKGSGFHCNDYPRR